MKHSRSTVKIIAVIVAAFVVLFAVFPLAKNSSLHQANADSLNAYPGVCLGGWEDPNNAAGAPDGNVAILNGVQAQIFCGSFQASDQSQTPVAVTLHFSWSVVFASEDTSPSVSTDTDSAAWSSVLDATTTATATPDESAATSSAASTTVATTTDDSVTASTTASSSTPSPPPDDSDASSSAPSTTSFLRTILTDPFALLVQKTFADSTDTTDSTTDTSTIDTSTVDLSDTSTVSDTVPSADDFMDVSYSLDGTTWTDLGQVSASDWQDYSVTIPVSSWSDINTLQIQLSPDIGADEPVVNLDSMWLEVDYNQSILGDLEDAASATINAVSDLSNSVDNTLTDLLSPNTSNAPQPVAMAQPAVTPPPPAPPSPPAHQYSFTLQGAESITVGKQLPWAAENTSGTASSASPTGGGSAPAVSLPATNTIQVSGPCSSAYYTILIFPDENDYETDPSLALYNEANKCVGGNFTQTISDLDLPSQLASGTYYLVVGNQGTKGPWVPDPEIYPIQLSATSDSTSSSQ